MSPALVLDWGIGGLATLRLLRARAPHLPLCYVSDSGYTPYGRVSPVELGARISQLCDHLQPSALLVACNAASSALHEAPSLPELTLGIIDAGAQATLEALERLCASGLQSPRVGIIGGLGTIHSGHYERLIQRAWGRRGGLTVISEPAQALSAHVEAGRLEGPELDADLDELCARLGSLDALTLACTHYPALSAQLQARLPDVVLIDPVERFVAQALSALNTRGFIEGSDAHAHERVCVYTTGDPRKLKRNALSAWGIHLDGHPLNGRCLPLDLPSRN